MAAAPAIVRFGGGSVADALAATQSIYEITLSEHPRYQVPILSFRGRPTGIDVTLVARTGILPQINTGMAGRVAGTGQVGAGRVNRTRRRRVSPTRWRRWRATCHEPRRPAADTGSQVVRCELSPAR